MGGKGSGGQDWQQMAGENAYNAGMSGQDYNTVMSNSVGYEAAAQMGWDQAMANNQPDPFMEMMASFSESNQANQTQMVDQQAAALAAAEAAAEEARIAEGVNSRNDAYSSYIDSAGIATDYINQKIADEQSQANLIGVELPELTDQLKSTRINDYFASIWGEGDQTNLDNLMTEFGNPDGFEGFSVTRGDASKTAGADSQGSEISGGGSKGMTKKSILSDEDESLGGGSTLLGGV